MHISNSNYSSFYSSYSKAINQDSKSLQDFRLTNAESKEIQVSASESLQTEASQTEALSNEEITQNSKENSKLLSDSEAKQKLDDMISEFSRDWSSLDSRLLLADGNGIGGELKSGYDLALSEKLANKPIPQEDDFFRDLDFLSQQMEAILIEGIKQDENSLEFQALLSYYLHGGAVRYGKDVLTHSDNYMHSRSEALEALSGLKKGIDPNNPNDIKKLNDFCEIMGNYTNQSYFLASGVGDFFYIADRFGMLDMLSYEQKSKIESALENVQVYALNQSGSLGNSFQLGDAIISWDGNPPFGAPANDWTAKITFLELDASLVLNYDSSQALFAILEQKDKQEQANQTSANTQTNQDLENQTLENQTLESRQAKKAYENYKSNPLTPKASKEMNDFVNEVIRKAKV